MDANILIIGPGITTTTLANGDVGTAYSQTVSATGGSGSYTFSRDRRHAAGGSDAEQRRRPLGHADDGGQLTFTVTATDTLGGSASQSYTVTINAAVAITTTTLANGDVGTAYSQTVSATGGSGSYTFSQTGGTLPAGVTLEQRRRPLGHADDGGQLDVHGDGDRHAGRQRQPQLHGDDQRGGGDHDDDAGQRRRGHGVQPDGQRHGRQRLVHVQPDRRHACRRV